MIRSKAVKIGIDPTFFASPVGHKQGLVYAFVVEFFEEIFANSGFDFEFIELSFDNTLESLDLGDVDLLVTPLAPNIETNKLYSFSERFLDLGDVFVTRHDNSFNFKDYSGKIIALQQHPNILAMFAKYPSVNVTFYTSIPDILVEITNFKVDGALIPYLSLASTLGTEYKYQLSVDTSKLYTERGLRLATKKSKYPRLINLFNREFKSHHKTKEALLEKWDLTL